MSTPSTVTATLPSHPLYSRLPEYTSNSSSSYRTQPAAAQASASSSRPLPYASGYAQSTTTQSTTSEGRQQSLSHPHYPASNASIAYSSSTPAAAMPSSGRRERNSTKKADWNDFYKNGLPKEVIVIDDDDSPQPARRRPANAQYTASQNSNTTASRTDGRHVDKRRRVDPAVKAETTSHRADHTAYHDDSKSSRGTDSAGRTASAVTYSTAPTSYGSSSTSSASSYRQQQQLKQEQQLQAHQYLNQTKVGEKRKRTQRYNDDDENSETVNQAAKWGEYHPPPNPPVKAADVFVKVIKDSARHMNIKFDDDDGHYIVQQDSPLTEQYSIVKLLGQGTFGKVVEAKDLNTGKRVAVKIIRAVQKYRDASRIELRVLSTLAANDKSNRNNCIHLRDCFDYRNHICIVTDLLGSSVFDFLKGNGFVPFPSTHIQSFARQLFKSVAFLHDLNLIHTDLKPENILLVSASYQTFTYNRSIPSSTRGSQRTAKYRKVLLNPEIRLIDFGSATFDDEYHSSVVSTRHYRAPEIILNLGWSFPCDIWSIGCILVEFFTGDALFQTHDNLEHLAMMEAVCNKKFDQDIIRRVRGGRGSTNKNSAAQYFLPRAFRLDYPNSETPRQSRKYVKNMKTLEETIPPTTDFNKAFLDLLAKIFVYKPEDRITAKEALQHEWFDMPLADDGTEALKIRREREAKAAASQSSSTSYR